jgi:hypothetical protein
MASYQTRSGVRGIASGVPAHQLVCRYVVSDIEIQDTSQCHKKIK